MPRVSAFRKGLKVRLAVGFITPLGNTQPEGRTGRIKSNAIKFSTNQYCVWVEWDVRRQGGAWCPITNLRIMQGSPSSGRR